jgi:8-oxo-dGTP pyrophosphatase MutT (NUDIX family)
VYGEGAGPAEPPRPWRLSSRLVVVSADRVLLLRARDPAAPRTPEWFEIPGGGVEDGETTAAAAVRETAEETGYQVPPDAVGGACWHGETTYRWLGRRHWAEMVMHVAVLPAPPPRRAEKRTPEEVATFLETHWLPLTDVLAGRDRFFPDTLPADLPLLLAGERLERGFTVWS